jgi:hypothetical protein
MDNGQSNSSGGSDLSRRRIAMDFLLEFGAVIIVVVLLVLSAIGDEVRWMRGWADNSKTGLYMVVAILAFLPFLSKASRNWLQQAERDRELRTSLDAVVRGNSAILEKASSEIEAVPLGRIFRLAESECPEARTVRIYAVTSRFISQHLHASEYKIDTLRILLSSGPSGIADTDLLRTEVKLAVEYSWMARIKARSVNHIILRQYDHYPTEWYVIFDDKLMIHAPYRFGEDNIGQCATSDTAFISRSAGHGRALIATQISSYDALFDAAEHHFGRGEFEGEYLLDDDGLVIHRRTAADAWLPTSKLSQQAPEPVEDQ